ncbi:hypothetical protein JCM10450v2_003465 [Rhodotorula kratochvilovae]
MHLQSLLPLALLSASATAAFAHAAPPNPDQLYALQKSAFSAAAESTPAASHGRKSAARPKRSDAGSVVKRHQHIQAVHHGRVVHGETGGMQKRRVQRLGGRKEDVRERERRGVVDSSVTVDDLERRDEIEPRAAEQYPLANAGGVESTLAVAAPAVTFTVAATSSSAAVVKASAVAAAKASSSAPSSPKSVSVSSGSGDYWRGVSSYYLHALDASDRTEVLDTIKGAGFKVVRIFIASVYANNKGCNSRAVNDLEHSAVGTYDDTILELIDQLMVECKARGLKLLIALSDRYALGFWSTDTYATQLNIVSKGSSGAQKVANAASFYTNAWAVQSFEARLAHIMNHKNALLGNQKWADLDEVIYAVEPQNEPQGHMAMASSTWACDRAKYLKSLITSNIKVSTGGGITTSDSLGSWATGCPAFDIISVHDYGTNAAVTAGALAGAKAAHPDKEVIMGEWGMAGANKAALVAQFVAAFKQRGISNMFWQITKPGAGARDFEVWTNEPSWQALTGQAITLPEVNVPTVPEVVASASKVVASASKSLASASKAAATAASPSSKPQWASATPAFSSYAAKASSYAEEGKSRVASAQSVAASKADVVKSAYTAAASKVESAAAEATSAVVAAVSASAAGQREALANSIKNAD